MTETQRGTALVTGAGKRIGRAIAERLARDGYAVAAHCYRSHAEAANLVDHIVAGGGRAAVVAADLIDLASVRRLVVEAADKLGPVTLLVNNASLFEPDAADDLNMVVWDQHFAINLRAPVVLAEAVVRQLPAGRPGAIVNIIDQRVLRPTPRFFSYTLTKSALWTATRTMAQAFAPQIRVNAVGPGPTLSNSRQSAADFARQAAAIPLGRTVLPHEVAEAVAYLAGAPSVTGQLLAVDGGQHLAWLTPDVAGIVE